MHARLHHIRFHLAILGMACNLILTACGMVTVAEAPAPSSTEETSAPTTEPSSTPEPEGAITFVHDALIAGIDVGELDTAAAAERLNKRLAALMLPLELHVRDALLMLYPEELELTLPVDELMEEAAQQQATNNKVRVPLQVRFNEDTLRQKLTAFSQQTITPPAPRLITSTDEISRSFGYVPGQHLDVNDALYTVIERLNSPLTTRRVTLELTEDPDALVPRPSFEELREQINLLANDWNGTVGLYLRDLKSGETISINPDTVFSAASIMKVGILLFAYISLPSFDAEQQTAIDAMIINSDNLRANDVLAATVGGTGTDAAYTGVLSMTEMLSSLGLQHSYMNMPYEGYDYLVGLRGIDIQRGPPEEGTPPYTDADPILRTTPAEISQLFLMINDCSQKQGELLARFPTLSARRCQEMLDLLAQNADTTRLLAGIPPGIRVEHKSGWVQDMHADSGIVRSPGGDYLLTVYLWRGVEELPDIWASPVIADFSRLVYTAYNPVKVK